MATVSRNVLGDPCLNFDDTTGSGGSGGLGLSPPQCIHSSSEAIIRSGDVLLSQDTPTLCLGPHQAGGNLL